MVGLNLLLLDRSSALMVNDIPELLVFFFEVILGGVGMVVAARRMGA